MAMFCGPCCTDAKGTEVMAVKSEPAQGPATDTDEAVKFVPPAKQMPAEPLEAEKPELAAAPQIKEEQPEEPQDQPVAESLPVEPQYSFEVSVQKRAGGLGVDLSPHDGMTLLIGKIKPGPLFEWNDERPADSFDKIQRGDRIVAVNGVTGDSEDILNKMRADETLVFTIRRLLDFSISISRAQGEKLGLFLADTGNAARILRVEAGPLQDANRKNGAELELRPGDEIFQVNETTGSGTDIHAVLSEVAEVVLKIRRPKLPQSPIDRSEPGELGC